MPARAKKPTRNSLAPAGLSGEALQARYEQLLESLENVELSRNHYAQLFDFAPVSCVVLNRQGIIRDINLTGAQLLQADRKRLINIPLTSYCPGKNAQKLVQHLNAATTAAEPIAAELEIRANDGRTISVRMISRRNTDDADLISTSIVDMSSYRQAEDITKQKRSRSELEQHVADRTTQLRRANAKLHGEIEHRKSLEDEVLDIVDNERRRIGQDLHDGLCQHLTATSFIADALAKRIATFAPKEARELRDIAGLVNAGASQARDIARGVHAVGVDAAGLLPALEELAARVNLGVTCRFVACRSVLKVNEVAAQHLYRIAQEAVVNAVKHAQPTEITITITDPPESRLSISDNGKGLPSSWEKSKGMGFHLMEYRARAIGSSLTVQRLSPRGTRVSCLVVVSTNDGSPPRKKAPGQKKGPHGRHR